MARSCEAGSARVRKRMSLAAMAVLLLASAPAAWAWAVKSYYPTAFEPALPDAAEARRLAGEPATIFQTLRHAHRQSLERSWMSVTPPIPDQSAVAPQTPTAPFEGGP
jgi:hypothetical protein